METKKHEWRARLHGWFTSGENGERTAELNVDEEAVGALALRRGGDAAGPVVLALPTLARAEEVASGLEAWGRADGRPRQVTLLPETGDAGASMPENESRRAKALRGAAAAGPGSWFVASVMALLAPAPPPDRFAKGSLILKPGLVISPTALAERLVEQDYDDEFQVSASGEFARRGGLFDIFSPSSDSPARIEFFGDEIESIRLFSAETQRATGFVDSYEIIPRGSIEVGDSQWTFLDYFPRRPRLIVAFPAQAAKHLELFGRPGILEAWGGILNGPPRAVRLLDPVESAEDGGGDCGVHSPLPEGRGLLDGDADSGARILHEQILLQQISQWLDTGYVVAALGKSEAEAERLGAWLKERNLVDKVDLDVSPAPHGLVLPRERLALLTENEIFFHILRRRRLAVDRPPAPPPTPTIESASRAELHVGDYAVHVSHGIGIFKGIVETESSAGIREALELEFDDEVTVHVPIWQAHLVSRYIGSGRLAPKLSKVGGKRWSGVKAEAARSARDLAAEMLRIQAMRAASPGHAFPLKEKEQRDFDESFPFPETPDQLKAAAEIKRDLALGKPMDRLICGDVGYGKTEVAIRAAFMAVMDGRQVAVLVPTTILAQQHFYTFQERFAEYPFIVEMLSRFRTPGEQRDILARLADGKIDVIIGTHRLVQGDVRFASLGLVIIDEEQRFGVSHKEKLKRLRATVDVLTMTATPIPRTLYMAMAGIRDLSTIMTAPSQRLPVQTVVCQHDEKIIANAIRRELQRDGQVFYLHNRVKSIEACRERLAALVPDATFATAHGQMPEDELEFVMSKFLEGSINVLVCTTIIESGLDISNANTIIIEHADRFGLAELYQLRGRVGRWTHQAYAYLLLPKHNVITGDARARLSAIRRFTHLGAGFRLALKDLEIRGAGNILGAQQSGHINAVGFELYCQLLKSAIAGLKSGREVVLVPEVDLSLDFVDFAHKARPGRVAASLSPDYVNAERLRIDVYRRLCAASSVAEIDTLADELKDRFGPPPKEASHMLAVSKIRIAAALAGFTSVSTSQGHLFLENQKRGVHMRDGKIPKIKETKPERILDEILRYVTTLAPTE